MAKDVVINFKGAEPVSVTKRFDRIPDGTYEFKVKTATLVQTGTDKPAISVALAVKKGAQRGRTIGDLFVLPRKGSDDSKFGIQTLLGLMVVCGIKRATGKVSAKQVAKALSGHSCVAEVAESTIPATGSYSERIVSAPQAYYAVGSKEAKVALKAIEAEASDEDEDEDEDEGDDEDTDEDEDEDEDEEGEDEDEDEKPRRRSKKASKSSKKSKKSKKADEDEDEEDDLYDEDEDEDED